MIELAILLTAMCLLAVVLRRPLERWNLRVFLEQMESLQRLNPARDFGLEVWAFGRRAHAFLTGITS